MDLYNCFFVPTEMSRPPIAIADLRPNNNVWKLAIRAVDLWIVKERNGQQHLEAVVQDSKVVLFLCIVFFNNLT